MSVASRSCSLELLGGLRSGVLAAAFALLTFHALPAEACSLRLAQAPETVRIDYDPFVIARPPGQFDLTLVNDGAEACDVELRLLELAGTPLRDIDLGGVGVAFRPREGSALVVGGTEPNVYRLTIGPGVTALVQLDAVVVSDAVAEAGEHRISLLADIGAPDAEPLIRALPLDLVLASPPRAQLNIAGAAGAFGSSDSVEVIDFGEAATGLTKRAFLQIRANTESRLTFQSDNAGFLKRLDSGPEGSAIAYQVLLDGDVLDLTHAVTRDVDPPRELSGQSMPLDFTLGSVGSQMSGAYRDLLTISISPR